ncbi:MAG: glycine cleavage T C-terminal barrel domain-containing protein, partial [Pirellulaceae bacterium]|nr:glycine cleavage T C-terminal barrel domain-containing protein [Pirellulaceae bacterium]
LLQSSIPEAPLGHVEVAFAGHPLSIRRCPTPLDGFWIHGEAPSLDALTPLLADDGCREIDTNVVEMLRVEAGIPRYGVDLDDQNLPQEVNRDTQAISFTKGCYLGQETVARIDALGHVNRLLTGLTLPPGPLPTAGMVIKRDGTETAHVTSSIYSPRLEQPLALAYVRREASSPGTVLDGAEVVSLPLD